MNAQSENDDANNDRAEKAVLLQPLGNTMLLQPLPSLKIECLTWQSEQPPIKPRSKRGQRKRIWRDR